MSLYCATRGEAGDPSLPCDDVAALRERELRSACDVLGVGRLWLDAFPDGGLHHVEPDAVVERVARFLRASRPAAVITFGPDGRTRPCPTINSSPSTCTPCSTRSGTQRWTPTASQWALSPLNLTGGWEAWSVEHLRLARTAGTRVVEDPLEALLTGRSRG